MEDRVVIEDRVGKVIEEGETRGGIIFLSSLLLIVGILLTLAGGTFWGFIGILMSIAGIGGIIVAIFDC
jgi:hypothetical protein